MERVGRLLGTLNAKSACLTDEEFLIAAWPPAVGKIISSHTRPARLVRDRLVVDVEDAVWQRQLFSLRSQILKRLEEIAGRRIAGELQFRIVPPKRQPARAEAVSSFADEAEEISDPMLRRIYKASRKKAQA